MWNYVVTAQKPTAVSRSIVGRFTGPSDLNLILCKSTQIEIQLLTPEGLQPVLEVPIYGRISTMKLYRPPSEQQDLLLIVTERYKFCILAYDPASKTIITRSNGEVHDRIGKPVEISHIALVDPECRMIGLHLYDGLFKVIPMESKGSLREAFNLRLEELNVVDIKILYKTNAKPMIAILYQDSRQAMHVKTYEISINDKEMSEGNWSIRNVEGAASMLIPVQLGGVIVLGEQTIMYHNGLPGSNTSNIKAISVSSTVFSAYGQVDDNRFLLGDHAGNLSMLILENEHNKITGLKLEPLGKTSIASTISYLDNAVVFVGSIYGDSQLLKLNEQKDENGSFLEQMDSYSNLGPIVDFCVVDLEKQGQGQVVTCSGAFKDGSLRIIRNGIGINEQATIDLPGIKGIWSLKPNTSAQYDKYIILAFVGETRVLAMTEEELEETEIAGFESEQQSIFCANVINDQFVQVTPTSVNLVDAKTLSLSNKWNAPSQSKITVASCNRNQIVIATGGGILTYLEIQGNALVQKSQVTLEHEISCVNIPNDGDTQDSRLIAVGMWKDITVRLYSIPDFKELIREPLGGEIIPRSVLLTSFEGINYLFAALGDGQLFTFSIDMEAGELKDKRKLSLGTQPIVFNSFFSNNQRNVFAASDRPTVIYSANKKLVFSNVNLKEVNQMCAFNSENFPDSLAIANEESLTIGTIDDIQKLHIRSLPLGEMPRRITHQEATNTFCVLTTKSFFEEETSYVKLIDATTFEIVNSISLQQQESGTSIVSLQFTDDANHYFAIGTAFSIPGETEPSAGRILVFRAEEGKLNLISETTVKGAVYALNDFNGSLVAGINHRVELFKWKSGSDGSPQLTSSCSHHGHILALYVASRGHFIAVGDLMKSISLLIYKSDENKLEEIARDFNPNWMTAVEVLSDDVFIGAENYYNLFTVRRNSDAPTDEERSRLDVCGGFHLGEFVNRFRHGSLVMKMNDSMNGEEEIPTMIFGTVSGSLGVVASLSQDTYNFFSAVQTNVNKVLKGVGGFFHEEWRSFSNERKTVPAENFLDGDLIEKYLELRQHEMQEVVKGLNITTEELSKRIEALQQALH